ncbi:MAG: oligosaccharide flippase family protein [Candidatus Eisenbacteria bacterium]
MKKLVTATALVGTSSLFGAFTALLRTKLLAVFLGTAGVGLLAQLGVFGNVLVSLASLGVGVGMAKYVAEFASVGDHAALARLKRTGTAFTWAASVLVVIVVCALSDVLARRLFGGRPGLGWSVIVTALSVPFVVQFTFHLSIIQGLKRMKEYAWATAVGPALGLLAVVPLVYFFRWNGAVVHLALAAVLGYVAVRVISRRVLAPLSAVAAGGFDRRLVRELLAYGVSSLVVGALYWLNLLTVRSVIIGRLGADANGLYQVAVGLSIQYLMLILNSVAAYSYPRLSELKDRESVIGEVRAAVRLSILLVTGCACSFLLLRRWLIPLLFAREFMAAESLLPVQFLADFFRAGAWMLGIWLLPQGRLRVWVGFDVLMNATLLSSFLLLLARLPAYGAAALLAAPIAHCVAYLIHFVLIYWYSRRRIGFSFGPSLGRLLVTSAGLIIVCGLAPAGHPGVTVGGFCLLAAWARLSVSASEIRAALGIVRNRLSGK